MSVLASHTPKPVNRSLNKALVQASGAHCVNLLTKGQAMRQACVDDELLARCWA